MRPVSYLTPKATVKETAGGLGAFAAEPIRKGETVAAFGGWILSLSSLREFDAASVYRSIQIDDDLYIAPLDSAGPGDMINHSCDPTCGLSGSQLLTARRDIELGEPLAFDYAMSDTSDYDEFACACGTPACRGRITGNDWKDAEIQARYRGWFSPYIQRKIDAMNARA